MIYVVTIVAWLMFIASDMETLMGMGVSNSNLFVGACGYMYAHASWSHLIVNTISLYMLWFPIRKMYIMRYNVDDKVLRNMPFFASILAGAVCAKAIPTVGMSGMVYFLLGALLMLNPTKRMVINYILVALAIIIQNIFGNSNLALHIFSFIEGAVFICIREFIYQYTHDTGLFSPDANSGTIYNNQ